MADLHKVGHVLLPATTQSEQQQPLTRVLIGTDAFALADAPTSSAVRQALQGGLQVLQQQSQQQQGTAPGGLGLSVEDTCVASGKGRATWVYLTNI